MQAAIQPFYVMEAISEAERLQAQGVDIIHLSVGQPSARLPATVLREAETLMVSQGIGYTHSLGMWSLREAISRFYEARYGVSVAPERVAVTVGASMGCALALMAAFERGARVGIGVPYYPAYPNMLKALGFDPVLLQGSAATRYQPTVEQLVQTGRLDGVLIASPSNPAGTVMPAETLAGVAGWCDSNGVRLISDEIYHGITFDDAMADTALRYSREAVVINSFSKYFLMPGYRLGWVVLPESMVRSFELLQQNFLISAPAYSQQVALAMFAHTALLDAEVARYATNRAMLLKAAKEFGLTDIAPADGAFYVYGKSTALDANSASLCDALLHEAHVCVVPGRDFDPGHGQEYVRLSYCGDTARLEQAIERLLDWKAGKKRVA